MRFDPAADPWGTAMLAAAALWLLALLVVLAASLGRTSKRTGGHLMLVSLLAFLGAAAGGTWARIQQADALAAVTPPPTPQPIDATVVDSGTSGSGAEEDATGPATTGPATDHASAAGSADGDASTGGPEPSGTTGNAGSGQSDGTATGSSGEPAAASTDPSAGESSTGPEPTEPVPTEPEPTEPEPTEPEPTEPVPTEPVPTEPVPTEPEPIARPSEPVVPEDLPRVEPLPAEPGAREAAIRNILADAKRAAGGGERCGNLKRVAEAWAQLQTVPVTRKAKSIAGDLERCRRRLLYSISQKRLGEMIEARDAWFEKLPSKLRKQHGLIVQSAISGGSHERLRIGNRELDAARADAVMDAGLRDDLVRLEFAHVVVSNGKKAKTYVLPVTPEGELGLPWLRAVGLGEPLRLVAE